MLQAILNCLTQLCCNNNKKDRFNLSN